MTKSLFKILEYLENQEEEKKLIKGIQNSYSAQDLKKLITDNKDIQNHFEELLQKVKINPFNDVI